MNATLAANNNESNYGAMFRRVRESVPLELLGMASFFGRNDHEQMVKRIQG